MRRLTVNFSEKNYEIISAAVKAKNISISKHLNQLIENSIYIDQSLVNQKDANNNSANNTYSNMTKILWKKNLAWTLESRYLLRCLVENLLPQKEDAKNNILEIIKSKSETNILELLDNLERETNP